MTFAAVFLVVMPAPKSEKSGAFWYIPYSKEDARRYLRSSLWLAILRRASPGKSKTAFFHGIYAPQNSIPIFRNNTLSALVRT